jgi:transcriptional regulator with XRE-family HTH domain
MSPRAEPPGVLRSYRLLAGYSRELLAGDAHVHPDTIRRLEDGRSRGTAATRAAIAAELKADPAYLFRGDE